MEPHIESWLTDLESRADIRFSCGNGIETFFLIEAKRLFVAYPNGRKDPLIDKYISQGMKRFISGRYARFQRSGAMLGYVHDQTTTEASAAVNRAIISNSDALFLKAHPHQSTLRIIPDIDESVHSLANGSEFRIFHLFTKIEVEERLNRL